MEFAIAIKSMTGFARWEFHSPNFSGNFEIKSYNNRFLDLHINLPRGLSFLEPLVRNFLSERIKHGKIECSLRLHEIKIPLTLHIDSAAAQASVAALKKLVLDCQIEDSPKLSHLLQTEGLINYERVLDEASIWQELAPHLENCFGRYDGMRAQEGRALALAIMREHARLFTALALIKTQAQQIEAHIKNELRARFTELLGASVSEEKILSELAIQLQRSTITEEIVRLDHHLASFTQTLSTEAHSAKKLDFLCQEINREINTIGSKNMLITISQAVVEMKDALENIREQLKNLE